MRAKCSQPPFEIRCELLISRLAIEIVHLIRIGLEIIEFELLRL
jgi:hypothetical protein